MVHALREIHRALAPDGILIDLRPLDDRWPVEVASRRETRQVGRLLDLEHALAGDNAANRAMDRVEREGLFERQEQEFFPLYYSWDSPGEMQEYIQEEWEEYNSLDEPTLQAVRSAWAVADGDSRVRIRVKMLIARWGKSGGKE
jgi:hypothetical protein